MTMDNFNFKKRKLTSGPHIIGMLMIVAGTLNLLIPVFFNNEGSIERMLAVGLGAIILGLIIVSAYSGTRIDFENKKTMKYLSLVGYKLGEWEKLPTILSIKVISKSYRSTNISNGISPTLSGKVTDFRTQLYSNAASPEFSFLYSNKEEALKEARHLAANLNAELVIEVQ
jgi:hypothetical protein